MFKKKEENPEKSPEKKSVKKPEVPAVKRGIATVLEFTGKEGGVCHVLVEIAGVYSDFKVGQVFEIK